MKSSSKNYINLRKVGGFYQCFDEDAYLLFYLFGYKVNNDRAGFPISSLNKIINTLDDKRINYMICNNNDDKSIKEFKRKNTYYHYVEVSKEAYNLEIKKISVLAQKLWDDYLVLDISNSFKKKYSSSG